MKGYKFAWHKAMLDDPQLKPLTKLVLTAMWDEAREDGTRVYPGDERLARRTGMSDKSVRTHRALARAAGWIVLTKPRPPGTRLADEYVLSAPPRVLAKETKLRSYYHEAPVGDAATCWEVPEPPTGDYRYDVARSTGSTFPPSDDVHQMMGTTPPPPGVGAAAPASAQRDPWALHLCETCGQDVTTCDAIRGDRGQPCCGRCTHAA